MAGREQTGQARDQHKELLVDLVLEATFVEEVLAKIDDLEAKLSKLKSDVSIKLFQDGDNLKIRGPKQAVAEARLMLYSPSSRSGNILVRGVANSEDVLFLLNGGTWGLSEDFGRSIQLMKVQKDFPVGFFCMYAAQNKVSITEKLVNFNCELKVAGYHSGMVKVLMKGPDDYVDNIFRFLETENMRLAKTLKVHYQDIEVVNKSAFLDELEKGLDTLLVTYQGPYLDLVLSDRETKNKEQRKQVVAAAALKSHTDRQSNLKNLLRRFFCSEQSLPSNGMDETGERKNAAAKPNEDTANGPLIREAEENKYPDIKYRVIDIDSDAVNYLEQCAWEKVLEEAAEYGIKACVLQGKLRLSPISQDFEGDCDKLEDHVQQLLGRIKSISIDVSHVPHNCVSIKLSEIEEEAKKCKVVVEYDDGIIMANGMADSLKIFEEKSKTILGIPKDSLPAKVQPTVSSKEDGKDEESGWVTIDQTLNPQGDTRIQQGVAYVRNNSNSDTTESPSHVPSTQYKGPQDSEDGVEPGGACARSNPYSGTQTSSQMAMTLSMLREATAYTHCERHVTIYCAVADITKLAVDCIVNAANQDLKHYGGVAYAIARAAGPQLEEESEAYIRSHGPLDVAGVCVTSAGTLPCKKVLHTVGPFWTDHGKHEECMDQLQEAFINCLQKADELRMSSIAFPAISSGVYGIPMQYVSQAACEAICTYCMGTRTDRNTVMTIYLVDPTSTTVFSLNAPFLNFADQGIFAVSAGI